MRSHPPHTLLALSLCALVSAPLLAGARAARAPATIEARIAGASSVEAAKPVDPCLQQVNEDGFGDHNNRYAWAMRTFGDHLYVGTLYTTAGVDSEDPYDAPEFVDEVDEDSTGTQIWRYDGSSWEQVVADGFGDVNNGGTRNLAVYDGALYAGTGNSTTGGQMWRSFDGVSWEKIAEDGFGNIENKSVRGMIAYRDKLYAGTLNDSGLGAEIWTFDGSSWEMAVEPGISDSANRTIATFHVYQDRLYVGTWSLDGCMLYSFDGEVWEQLVGTQSPTPAGFGDPDSGGIFSIVDFHDSIYVSTYNFASGFTVWRSSDLGHTWTQVGENGFGDPKARYGWRMIVHEDQLYLGTFVMGYGSPAMFKLGFKFYRTADGDNWIEESGPRGTLAPPGFGDQLNYGVRTLEVFQDDLYVGTAQCFFCSFPVTGTEIWRRDTVGCGP